ncbi:MAG TPA: CusA/CzcA family heavy metal efflux RND transporter [Gemmataceae bacterium]|nr:CusA/CzcA family heavy metal efflux RND transporter [Gemmataceae bacterium]
MLNAIIDWSLRNRFIVLAGAVMFIVLGAWSLSQLDIDAFPDTTPVQVQINTIAPGLAPEEMERQITYPVEQAINGLPHLQQLRSISKFGISQIVVVFDDGTDIYFARQMVNERLSIAKIPEGVPRPQMGPIATGLGEVFHYIATPRGVNQEKLTEKERVEKLTHLRTTQDWSIKPAMRTVAGAAEINGWGGYEKQYQVRIDPKKLLQYGVSFDQVMQAVRANNLVIGGGNIQQAGAMYLVRGLARTITVDEIKKIIVDTPRPGVPIQVGDVADVEIGHDIRLGGVTSQGQGEVVLGLCFMLMGENSHDVTGRLKAKLDDVKKTLPPDVEVTTAYDRTRLVDQVIHTVYKNLFEGGLLVVAVLFIFLGNLRAGLIVAVAIPISMLFAFCGMWRFGIAGSLLSLGAIDFGLVVDSSVVMVENVVRHLAHDKNESRSRLDIVRDAAIEVRTPTMFGELIIMIVYLPILTLQGVEGKLFRPMALTVIFALIGSLVLSLTLMPVLTSLLLPRHIEEKDPWLVRLARWLYAPILRGALRYGVAVLILGATALGCGVLIARGLGGEAVPKLSEGSLVVLIVRLAGTDINESLRYNTRMEKLLLAQFPDEVERVWCRCGTAEIATDPMGPEETDMFIILRPREQWQKAANQTELEDLIRKQFQDLPGQRISITQPIQQRMDEMTSGVKAQVAVKLFGDDFDVLKNTGDKLAEVLRSIEGAADVSVEQISGLPVLAIQVKQAELARYNVPARSVLDLVESVGGKSLGEVVEGQLRYSINKPLGERVEGQLRFPLAVRLPERLRASPQAIGAMSLTTPAGERVPLSRLADVKLVEGPAQISREWSQRRIAVQCNVSKRDIGSFVAEAQQKIAAGVKLPPGRYRLEWGGQFENMERARTRLLIVVPAALMLIFALLYVTYNRLADVLLVFTAVPFASVGGVLALWLRDLPFSISAGVGFIALSGVSVLNSMVLVTFIRQLRDQGVPPDRAIEEAALTRLRPVLMTALVASLGFVPMALSNGVGAEVQRPLATVVIGGVISSTLLTLLVLPVLYHFFGPSMSAKAYGKPLIPS